MNSFILKYMNSYAILDINKGVEMENQKNNSGLMVLIVILCLIVLGLGGYIVYDKVINKEKSTEQNSAEEQIEEKLTTKKLLSELTGEWGACKDSSCYGIIIGKRDNGEYYYTPYLMWSDGGTSGTIKKVSYKEKNVYLLTVYYAAYEGMESSGEEHTDEYEINISEVSSDIIYINNTKYQKITTDREAFFNSIK